MFYCHDDFTVKILSVLHAHTYEEETPFKKSPYTLMSLRIGSDYKIIEKNRVHIAKAGSISIIPPNAEFKRITGEGRFISVRFFTDKMPTKDIVIFNPANFHHYQQKFLSLQTAWSTRKTKNSRLKCISILYDILSEIELENTDKIGGKQSLLSSVVDYIHTNYYSNKLTVNKICTVFNVSDTYLRRIFMKSFNLTPIQYINKLKVSYAKELLLSGEYSTSIIAEKCGFNSTSYFFTVFKKETGYTPMDYIKNKTW